MILQFSGSINNPLEGWVVIHTHSHPTLFQAFEIISHDRGAGAGHLNYGVPKEWVEHLRTADTALATLTPSELEIFCIGEQTKADVIAMRSKELYCTHKMLNSFFEDWN